jgi:hypothetical protein
MSLASDLQNTTLTYDHALTLAELLIQRPEIARFHGVALMSGRSKIAAMIVRSAAVRAMFEVQVKYALQ